MTNSAGVFFSTQSYTSNVSASSTSKLVVAGEAYVEDPKGDWEEHNILLIYKIRLLHNLLEMCFDSYCTKLAWIITLTQTWEEIVFMMWRPLLGHDGEWWMGQLGDRLK
jgi:hypothetical protein